PGRHPHAPHIDPLLPRSHHHVLCLRTLRPPEQRGAACRHRPAQGHLLRAAPDRHGRLCPPGRQVGHGHRQVHRARPRGPVRQGTADQRRRPAVDRH
ncbi:hypothetical protein BN1708_018581, partial [Verticillium longisporum]